MIILQLHKEIPMPLTLPHPTFAQPFYGEEVRLVVCGYVRPEANFTSLEALVTRIHKDADMSKEALGHQQLQGYAADPFLQPQAAAALKN
jgi:riboflavin kinase